MRIWAEVYDSDGTKLAFIDTITSCNTADKLDEAGTFDLQCALDQDVIDYLTASSEVVIYAQEDNETPVVWTRGTITKPRTGETAENVSVSRSGRDQINELNFRTVGLGRAYNAQTISTIMADLVALVPGWTVDVESAAGAMLQTARFDGSKVLRAILQSCKQAGLHIRRGTASRTLEVGAFGTAAALSNGQPIWAMRAPSSVTPELYANDAVLLIDSVSVTEDSDPVVNWAIPMGAGEGTAATTLKDTTYTILNSDNTTYRAGTTPTYPIYRRVNDFDIDEYYIDASDGDDIREDTLNFKTIGPIANSSTAKQLASDALADAAMQSLARTRVAQFSLDLSVRKMRVSVQPGDLIHVQYKGMVPTAGSVKATRPTLTYIDVDDDFWVMGVQHTASESGFTHKLQVSTIDRKVMNETDLMVEVLDRTEVRNVVPGIQPYNFDNTWQDSIANTYKNAVFPFKVNSYVTNLPAVIVHWRTLPLWIPAFYIPLTPPEFNWEVRVSYNYPSDVRMFVNGVDVTSIYGPSGDSWNLGGVNAALDVTCDISRLIEAAGIYNTHTIHFTCGSRIGPVEVYSPPRTNAGASTGIVELSIFAQGQSRAI